MSDQVQGLSGKVGLDVTDYKAGIVELNRNIRLIDSGFRASAASLGDWDRTANGLEQRIKALTDMYDLQKDKVILLTHEYKKIAAEKGANSRAAQDLQIRINKETESLNKMGAELEQSKKSLDGVAKESKTTGKEVKDLGDKAEETGKKSGGLHGVLKGLGDIGKTTGKIIAGIAASVVALGIGLSGLVMGTANASGELVDLSLKTGISTERLQELQYIGGQVGTSLDTMTGALSKFTVNMGKAGTDKGVASTFRTLGISIRDAKGQLRDADTVFFEAIDALGQIKNETQRDILSNELFGKSYMELNPLIKAGGDELERLKEKARQTGAVMSEETVANFEAFGDTVDGLKLSLKGTVGTILGSVLPGFQGLADGAGGYLQQLSLVFLRADGDSGKFASGLGELLGRLITTIGKNLPGLASAGLGVIQGIINAIMQNMPVLLPAVLQILTTLAMFLVQNVVMLTPAVLQIVISLVNVLLQMLPMLITAAVQIILALATGLTQALPQLIPAVAAIIPQIVLLLLENLPLILETALNLIVALAMGLVAALPVLIPEIPKIMKALVEYLIQSLPLLLMAAIQIILALAMGLIENLPLLLTATVDIIVAIIDAFKNTNWQEIGENILEGVKTGLLDKWDGFISTVGKKFKEFGEYIKDLLGIHSPSTVFADIGSNMALGMGVGFGEQMNAVRRQMRGAVNGLTAGMNVPVNVTTQGGVQGQQVVGANGKTYQLYFETYNEAAMSRTLRQVEMLYG